MTKTVFFVPRVKKYIVVILSQMTEHMYFIILIQEVLITADFIGIRKKILWCIHASLADICCKQIHSDTAVSLSDRLRKTYWGRSR